MRAAQPIISVDTKKKELIGNSANHGTQWRKKGEALQVQGHDFPDPAVPRAHPNGIYELTRNRGVRQCRDRPRHGDLCRRVHPGVVGRAGATRLSPGEAAADYGGRGRQQWGAVAVVEMGTPTVGR